MYVKKTGDWYWRSVKLKVGFTNTWIYFMIPCKTKQGQEKIEILNIRNNVKSLQI